MRFRKSVRICKGVRVNFSKSGASLTIGGKGSSINIGKNGTYLNQSIPGTGLYDRKKIGNGFSGMFNNQSSTLKPTQPIRYSISYNASGKLSIVDEKNIAIVDPEILRQITSGAEFKKATKELSQHIIGPVQERVNSLTQIYKLSCPVHTKEQYKAKIKSIAPKGNDQYPVPQPSPEAIRKELEEKANNELSILHLWMKGDKIQEYIDKHFEEAYEEKWLQWKKDKLAFEEKNCQKVPSPEQEKKKRTYIKLYKNEPKLVHISIDNWLSTVQFPFEFNINYEIKGDDLFVDVDLPEIEDLPLQQAKLMPDGNIDIKPLPKTKMNEAYYELVLGLAIFFTTHLMNCAIGAENVIMSAYTQRRNTKGAVEDEYIYSIRFNRDKFSEVSLDQDPEKVIAFFQKRINVKNDKSFEQIQPY